MVFSFYLKKWGFSLVYENNIDWILTKLIDIMKLTYTTVDTRVLVYFLILFDGYH